MLTHFHVTTRYETSVCSCFLAKKKKAKLISVFIVLKPILFYFNVISWYKRNYLPCHLGLYLLINSNFVSLQRKKLEESKLLWKQSLKDAFKRDLMIEEKRKHSKFVLRRIIPFSI